MCEFFSERGGGVRSYLTKLLNAASAHGHELVVVAPGPRDEVTDMGGGRLVRYAGPPMPYDPSYRAPIRVDRMRQIVLKERPDVLQVSSPFLPAVVAATLGDVPVRSYVYHSDPIGCYLRPALQRVLPERAAEAALEPAWAWMRTVSRRCDVTVVAGDWLKEILKRHGFARVEAVPFGITPADFGPNRRDEAVRRELLGRFAGDPSAKLLLIAGRLAVDKRQALLVDAVAQVAQRHPVALVVLGDGPEAERLRARARGLPQVTFLKFTRDRDHYASILASCDVLVHGSRAETYGFVIAETLASGTPVVVPNEGAAPTFGIEGCGYAYPPRADAETIANAVETVLEQPADELEKNALLAARRQPSMDDHFEQLFELYARQLAEKRSSVWSYRHTG